MHYLLTVSLICSALFAGCSKEKATAAAPEKTPVSQPASPKEVATVKIFDVSIKTLGGDEPTTLAAHKGKALLIVNVASKCGATPQYEGLEALYKEYSERGLVVLGFPSNQFGGQEPGSAEEIKTFCKTNYGIDFPMYEKVEVNGPGRHPIYAELTKFADADGVAGDIKWNFEKFVVSADGSVVKRFRTPIKPRDPALIEAIEAGLPR